MQLSRRHFLIPLSLAGCADTPSARRTADAFIDRYYSERNHSKALEHAAQVAAARVERERALLSASGQMGPQPKVYSKLLSQAPMDDAERFTYALTVDSSGVKLRKEVRLVVRKLDGGFRVVFFDEKDLPAN